MPLVLNGIRFETLPEIWTASPISSYLTYQQNVELEEYYEKNTTLRSVISVRVIYLSVGFFGETTLHLLLIDQRKIYLPL